MTTKRKPKKSAAKPKRKRPIIVTHSTLTPSPDELVFQPGTFAPPERSFWQRVGDFFKGRP